MRQKLIYRERREIRFDNNELYMVRWYIFDCKWFGLKLHKILLSDHDCIHDHPWNFISLILKGGYVEHSEKNGKMISKIYHPFNLLFRKAEHKHKLEIHQTCWTLVMTLKVKRKWGFWRNNKWIHWKEFNSTQKC